MVSCHRENCWMRVKKLEDIWIRSGCYMFITSKENWIISRTVYNSVLGQNQDLEEKKLLGSKILCAWCNPGKVI